MKTLHYLCAVAILAAPALLWAILAHAVRHPSAPQYGVAIFGTLLCICIALDIASRASKLP
jgi:4-amino-4-deoxy-L-arabinose transferase-like glycosyltransferase